MRGAPLLPRGGGSEPSRFPATYREAVEASRFMRGIDTEFTDK